MNRWLWILVCAALLFSYSAVAPGKAAASVKETIDTSASAHLVALDDWEYAWEVSSPEQLQWQKADSALNPSGWNGSSVLWLRSAAVPRGMWNDPVLKLRIHQLFEVYSEDQLVYRYGMMDLSRKPVYQGTPTRIIPLPAYAIGKPLTIRIYSDGPDIGLVGKAEIAARSDAILYLLKEQIGRLILGCMYVLMGLLSFYPYVRLSQLPFLSFGCFAVLFGIYTLTRTTLVYLFVDIPMLWMYVELITLIGSAASLIAFFGQLLDYGYHHVIARLWRFHLLYGFGFLALGGLQVIHIRDGLFVYQIILMLSMAILLVQLVAKTRHKNRDARILLAASGVFFVLGSIDIFTNILFTNRSFPPVSYYGMLLFLLALISVLIRRSIEIIARLSNSEKLSAAGQLAAGIAHEIRNPLTVVSGYLQLMKHNPANREMADIMLSEVNRMNLIMNEFLFLAKPSKPKFAKHSVRGIIHDVLLLFEAQARASRIELKQDCPVDLPLLYCDPNQLKQVFINILKNALEAMKDGGQIEIKVRQDKRDRTLTVCFTDQGCGIPKSDMARIGEPFYTTKESGNGLGIMVTRSIIDQHKGTFYMDSTPGVGTTVVITLPLKD